MELGTVPSVAGADLEHPAELAVHERLHDRQAEALARVEVETGSQPHAVVDDVDVEVAVVAPEPHLHRTADRLVVLVRERVVDRVLHQLVEHHRERGGQLAGQLARVADHLEPQAAVAGRHRLLHHPHERLHDLTEVDELPRLARQRLVDDRDRADPALRLGDRDPRLA